MNRKIVILAVALLAVAMLATPLVSAAAGGNKVPASMQTTYKKAVPPEDQWFNPGGITKSGIWHVGEIEVYYGILTIGTQEYLIYSYNPKVNAMYNSGKGLFVSQSDDAMWYVTEDPTSEEPTDDGFTGKITLSFTNYVPPFDAVVANVHCLMHGFGDFAGQTLELSRSGIGLWIIWEGFCIKG